MHWKANCPQRKLEAELAGMEREAKLAGGALQATTTFAAAGRLPTHRHTMPQRLPAPQHDPTQVFEDNGVCKKLSRNYCGHDRFKHLD